MWRGWFLSETATFPMLWLSSGSLHQENFKITSWLNLVWYIVNSKSTAVHVTNAGEEPANEATSSEQNSNRFALPLKIQQGNILWRMARPCLNVWSRKRGSEDGVYLWNGMCIVCGMEWRPTCSALTSYCVVSAAMSCCKTNAIFSWSYGVTWCHVMYKTIPI